MEQMEADEQVGQADVDDLPDEILLHIFSYLTAEEIKEKVGFVCQRWNVLSADESLIVQLRFGPEQSTETIVSSLQVATNLRNLKLISRRDVNEILGQVSSSNKKLNRLKVVSLCDNRMAEIKTEIILQLLSSCTKLTELILKRSQFDRPEQFFRDFATIAANLKKVNFNHNMQLGSVELSDMVEALNNVEDIRIHSLFFDSSGSVTPYHNAPVTVLATKFRSTLQVLKLNTLALTNDVMPYISQCSLLRVLHLYRLINISDDSLHLLTRLPCLEKLVITVPRAITTQGWTRMLVDSNLSRLKLLTISNSSSVEDEVLVSIAANMKHLESLGFPGCRKITVIGASAVIQGCDKLTSLNFFSTKGCVAESFPLIPVHLRGLRLLIYRSIDRPNLDINNMFAGMDLVFTTSYKYH